MKLLTHPLFLPDGAGAADRGLCLARPLELDREPLDVRALLAECARDCNVEIDLSGVPADCLLTGDRTAMRQALSNLLRNSAQAAPAGRQAVVSARAESSPTGPRLVLRDNGSGIPPQDLSRIFIPFFTTKPQGTGLGLPLVHRIISEHGGTIAVASDPSGTTFTLSFPKPEERETAIEPR